MYAYRDLTYGPPHGTKIYLWFNEDPLEIW